MPEQVGNENIKRSLRQATFASPWNFITVHCFFLYHSVVMNKVAHYGSPSADDVLNRRVPVPLATTVTPLSNVHVYSQRVQKYTKSSRTQNVKKKSCLHLPTLSNASLRAFPVAYFIQRIPLSFACRPFPTSHHLQALLATAPEIARCLTG